ncbi:unnamed protein product, partial [marine sediment metagenome]
SVYKPIDVGFQPNRPTVPQAEFGPLDAHP